MTETEIRAIVADKNGIMDKLKAAGFLFEAETEQHDIMFDYADARLFRKGYKIRLRIEGSYKELTYKGDINASDSVSRRLELNIPLQPDASAQDCVLFFEALGYPLCFQIKKKRTKCSRDNVFVVFDEWPIIGCMMEIEGTEADIFAVAHQFAPDVTFGNYRLSKLFQEKMAQTGKTLEELKNEYWQKTKFDLGKIELILGG